MMSCALTLTTPGRKIWTGLWAKPPLYSYWLPGSEDRKTSQNVQNETELQLFLISASAVTSHPSTKMEIKGEKISCHLVLSKCNGHLHDSDM